MKWKNRLGWVVIAVLITAISASARVSTDYDRSIDFSRYKTYSWAKVQTPDTLWDERVKNAVNSELAAKGWTLVPSGGEVSVAARAAIHNQQELNTFYDGFGGRRWGVGMGMSTTTVDNYKVGTLIVEMFDGSNKDMIWHGVASGTLSNNSDKNIKNLDKNVHKLFEHFPPEAKR
jgi:Domain of unknown function (DUF4136)